MNKYSGRLELTWTNKHLRLLAHEDENRKPPYEWVPNGDYRVSEVRLLHEHETVGEVRGERSRAKDNLLIQGDALCALTSLLELPEFSREYAGKVKLVYIDPPFNTGQTFAQYDDGLEHSVWLTMLRDRLLQVRQLLSPDGSVWLHLDDGESHRARCVLDEVFGADKFVATVIWQKKYSRENRTAIGAVHDYIHVYAPMGKEWKTVRNRITRPRAANYRNPNNDPRGLWRPVPMTAQGFRKNQMYEIVSPGGKVHTPPKGRCWSVLETSFKELLNEGRIYFGKDGNAQPNTIRYLDEDEGLVPWTWWPHEEVGNTDESKKEMLGLFPDREAFATPKPEHLMERIIHIATNPGDVVVDCFLGSATTVAVAHKMNRRWVGVERSSENIAEFALPRLRSVVSGDDDGGVSQPQGWRGGGGFRVLDVAPSMFDEDEGLVVLADWATNGLLGEACAAQLGYEYCNEPPFCGRKGRVRLAVVDGLVSTDVAKVLVQTLGKGERVTVCGTSYDPEARTVLKEICPGSTLRKIPSSILSDYASSRRSRLADALDWSELDTDVEEQEEVQA